MIKKSILITLIAFIFLITTVQAAEVVFEGWVDHEETLTILENEYSFFIIADDLESSKLHAGRYGTLFANRGQSEETGMLRYEYRDARKKETADSETREDYEYEIKIIKTDAGASFSRIIDKDYPYYLDTFNIIATIENEQEEGLKESHYEQELPEGIERVGQPEVTKIRNGRESTMTYKSMQPFNTISWRGVIREGEAIVVTQKVKVKAAASTEPIILPEARYTYTYHDLPFEKTEEEREIQIGDPLTIEITEEERTLGVNFGDRVKYDIKIKNRHEEEYVYIDRFAVQLSETTSVDFKPNELKEDEESGELVWDGKLAAGQSKTFSLTLILKGAENNIMVKSEHSYRGLELQKEAQHTSGIDIEELETEIKTNLVTYTGKDKAQIRFFIENTNPNIKFYNVHIQYTSNLFEDTEGIFTAGIRENKLTKSFEIDLPDVQTVTREQVEMSGTYETESGISFEFSKVKVIEIHPRPEVVRELRENTETSGDGQETITIQTGIEEEEEENTETTEEKEGQRITVIENHEEKEMPPLLYIMIILILIAISVPATIFVIKKRKLKEKRTKQAKDIYSEIGKQINDVLERVKK
jgi:hypothetical protein